MEKTLYPLHFTPVGTQRPWGTENWLLADLGYIDSEIRGGWLDGNSLSELMQTYLEKVTGDDAFEYYGLQFPVTVKVIDFDGRTPVFVHADDTVAEQRYDSLGRTALWQVVSAQPGATLYLGFKERVSAQSFYAAAQEGRLEELLNRVTVQEGDRFVIEPGVPYAFAGKARIAEIAEASSLIFDLSDPEDLVEAFDFVSLEGYRFRDKPGMTGKEPGMTGKEPGMTTSHFRVTEQLGPEEGEACFVLHLSPDASELTLYPAEGEKSPFPKEGLFILPGRQHVEPDFTEGQ